MSKTFEVKLRSIIAKARFGTTVNRYEEMPEYIQKEIDAAVMDSTAIHQAEMDRVIEESTGFLRQWLNEDRITDPNKIVTDEQIQHWLRAGARYKAIKENK